MAVGMIAVAAVVTIVAGMTETVTTTDMIVGTIGAVITVTRDVRLPLVVTPLAEGAIHVVLAQVQVASKAVIPRPLAGNAIKVLPMRKASPEKCEEDWEEWAVQKGGKLLALSAFQAQILRYGFSMFLSTSKRRRFSLSAKNHDYDSMWPSSRA